MRSTPRKLLAFDMLGRRYKHLLGFRSLPLRVEAQAETGTSVPPSLAGRATKYAARALRVCLVAHFVADLSAAVTTAHGLV